jgi:hypothetical protein
MSEYRNIVRCMYYIYIYVVLVLVGLELIIIGKLTIKTVRHSLYTCIADHSFLCVNRIYFVGKYKDLCFDICLK